MEQPTAIWTAADGTKTVIPLILGAPLYPPGVTPPPFVRELRRNPGRPTESSLAKYRKK